MELERVGVAGLGLIGTSVAQGLLGSFAREVVGYDPSDAARQAAAGSFSRVTDRYEDLGQCDLVVIAAPPSHVGGLLEGAVPWRAVVTDVASVKAFIADAAPPELRVRYVPGHPMAGSEAGGARSARPDLFHGAHWVLCPFDETSDEALGQVRSLVQHLRALPVVMGAKDHDRHVALLSHLPHILANTLLLRSREFDFRAIHGGSWRDLTRVGGSNPALWADILIANGPAVLEELSSTGALVERFRSAIEMGDAAAVADMIESAGERE